MARQQVIFLPILKEYGIECGAAIVLNRSIPSYDVKSMDTLIRASDEDLTTSAIGKCTAMQMGSLLAISKEIVLVARTFRLNKTTLEKYHRYIYLSILVTITVSIFYPAKICSIGKNASHTNTVRTIQYHSDIKLFAILHVAITLEHMAFIVPYYFKVVYSRGISIIHHILPTYKFSNDLFHLLRTLILRITSNRGIQTYIPLGPKLYLYIHAPSKRNYYGSTNKNSFIYHIM